MSFSRCEADALRRLADMPFLDRLELAALTGWSRGAVYDAVSRLENRGMVEAVPHASPLVPPTRRHALTAAGVERKLAELDRDVPLEELLYLRPVSRQWRRGLLERLDAVAVIYRLASAINQVYHPLVFRWYRAMPLDAAIALPDGRTLAVVRQGNTSDRTAFGKRLWRLGQLPPTSAVLMLLPDEVRLRQARQAGGGVARSGVPGPGERRRFRRRRGRRLAHPLRFRAPGPANRAGPHRPSPFLAPAETAPTGRDARRPEPRRRLPAAVFAQAGGEAGRGSAGRLALAVAPTPGRVAWRQAVAVVPGDDSGWRIWACWLTLPWTGSAVWPSPIGGW